MHGYGRLIVTHVAGAVTLPKYGSSPHTLIRSWTEANQSGAESAVDKVEGETQAHDFSGRPPGEAQPRNASAGQNEAGEQGVMRISSC